MRYYINKRTREIITSEVQSTGNGWYNVRVGEYISKIRGSPNTFDILSIVNEIKKILKEKYPNYEETSLFSDLSYHSALVQGKQDKITNYGMKKYCKDFSTYRPLGEFKFNNPVKSHSPENYGEHIEKATLHKWRYVVIEWKPVSNGTQIRVEDSIKDPINNKEKVLYKSKWYPESKYEKVYEIFLDRVEKAKKWKNDIKGIISDWDLYNR